MPRSKLDPPPTAPTPRPSFTADEVAGLLRVDLRTVRRYIERGLIRTVPVGRLVRIPAEEVDRIMRDGV